MQATAQAQPNIALVKYWGKQSEALNIPATSSLSVTLDALWTRTSVRFSSALVSDRLSINGIEDRSQLERVTPCLDALRQEAGTGLHAEVVSESNFPVGAGIASSASGFAALVTAACAALDLDTSRTDKSRLARRSSASAARSVFGGFVEMQVDGVDDPSAQPLLAQSEWPLEVLVVVTSSKAKPVGSTAGMKRSSATSDFYRAWVDSSAADFAAARRAVLDRDFNTLAEVSEANCLKMHGVMLSTRPALVYWNGATVEIIHRLRQLRAQGASVFFTIDAGPQVKAICLPRHLREVQQAVRDLPGVIEVMHSRLGGGARVVSEARRAQAED